MRTRWKPSWKSRSASAAGGHEVVARGHSVRPGVGRSAGLVNLWHAMSVLAGAIAVPVMSTSAGLCRLRLGCEIQGSWTQDGLEGAFSFSDRSHCLGPCGGGGAAAGRPALLHDLTRWDRLSHAAAIRSPGLARPGSHRWARPRRPVVCQAVVADGQEPGPELPALLPLRDTSCTTPLTPHW